MILSHIYIWSPRWETPAPATLAFAALTFMGIPIPPLRSGLQGGECCLWYFKPLRFLRINISMQFDGRSLVSW